MSRWRNGAAPSRCARLVPPGASHVGIRAHFVHLSEVPGGENSFACRVLDVVESPFEVTVHVELNRARIEVDVPTEEWSRLAGRSELLVHLDPEKLLLLRDDVTVD